MTLKKSIPFSLLMLLFLMALPAYCQTGEKVNIIHLTGRTLTDNNEPVPYVHIILVNKKLATASDLQGNFNFPAEVNDTILFRAVGFKYSTLIVRDTFPIKYPYIPIMMHEDTIQLRELVIRPWQGNYERFKQAVLAYKLPVTDLDRAEKNLNMMDLKALLINAPPTPTMAFRNTMKVYNDRLYWAGQLPPVSITNPLAWAQFFKALKKGEFKKK
ncbi:MAG: hypothetical protein D4R64_09160 [Porphyromonadaceae bacterium]|nr:MAG: hypothetical protein D4R64_09160 [Porphyromonadaceae bacterium]